MTITTAMRKFIFILATAIMAFAAASCAALRMTPEEKAKIEAKIQDDLDDREFIIDVNQMNPLRGPSRNVNNFSLEVKEDRLISRLPYFGQAWNVPYGGGKGMNFESKISDYIETMPKPDRRQITIATNNGEDNLVFVIVVFTNGKASIDVRSRNRESISYSGDMRVSLND